MLKLVGGPLGRRACGGHLGHVRTPSAAGAVAERADPRHSTFSLSYPQGCVEPGRDRAGVAAGVPISEGRHLAASRLPTEIVDPDYGHTASSEDVLFWVCTGMWLVSLCSSARSTLVSMKAKSAVGSGGSSPTWLGKQQPSWKRFIRRV